jgi:3,4-dihydroxy-2-butanone 4-phosphate synthase
MVTCYPVDDEDRENEVILIIAADFISSAMGQFYG